jgi:dolichyl-phosphate-mannose--protein O-mannosyl transferase
LTTKKSFNTVWRIQPRSGSREDRRGEPVYASDAIILEHVGTNQNLSNDKIPYRNDFGNEMEVSAFNITTKGKTQLLAGETTGHLVRENTHKTVLN